MSQAQIEPAYFDIPGFRQYVGVGTTSTYKLISEGKIEARKFGKKTLISKESVDRFLDSLPTITSKAA